ncbi:MAG: ATP-binding cassette domain-containing protein [Betaproteobacteria bacterium]
MNDTRPVALDFAVRTEALTKRYGDVLAVDRLQLEIPAGQFFGLLGPNGSGKTTTIHMLSTLVRPSSGRAAVAGHDVEQSAVPVRASIGLVFQDSALDRTLSIAQNLRFAGLLHNLPPKLIATRSQELLQLFDLNDKRDRPVGSLSGGMRRAVDIVRGVIHHPRILFLDEPTIGLDLPNRRKIWRFIERLRGETGMTVLLTTHYLEEADGCDQVAFIKAGAIVDQGQPRALVDRLAQHIVEIEGAEPGALADPAVQRLGEPLQEGDLSMFRYADADVAPLAALQTQLAGRARAVRIRRPNLNDVFLWVNAAR